MRRRPERSAASRVVPAGGGPAGRARRAAVARRSPRMMASPVRETNALRERVARSLAERREPGAAELCDALDRLLDGAATSADASGLERLQKGVYRLRVGDAPAHTLVIDRKSVV